MSSGSRRVGIERMRALLAAVPRQVVEGYRAGLEVAASALGGSPSPVFIVGMGGSGIAGDLVGAVVERESDIPIRGVRAPELPRAVGAGSLVILSSYSGNTWEVLRAYDEAGRRRARRVVIGSGGRLAERAERDGVPWFPLAPGLPPRSTVGSAFGGLLGLFDRWLPESNEKRIVAIAQRLERRLPRIAAKGGPAAEVASRIGTRFPIVYAPSELVPLARRWKTQIEENAKRLAAFDEIPEAMHNALVAWDAIPPRQRRQIAPVLLEWPGVSAPVAQSQRYLARLLESRSAGPIRVPLTPADRIEAILSGLLLGDYASVFLADRFRTEPEPFPAAIAQFKAYASRTTPAD